MALTTADALEEWLELLTDFSGRWGELMDTAWKDLPPDMSDKLLKASRTFADTADELREALEPSAKI